jgi:hypothetical protein
MITGSMVIADLRQTEFEQNQFFPHFTLFLFFFVTTLIVVVLGEEVERENKSLDGSPQLQ